MLKHRENQEYGDEKRKKNVRFINKTNILEQ